VVDVDVGLEQPRDDRRVAALRRPDQAGPVVAVLGVDVGAGVEREVEQPRVVTDLAGGDQVGALLRLVLGVDVGALLDELSRRGDVVLVRRGEQLSVEVPLLAAAARERGDGYGEYQGDGRTQTGDQPTNSSP
jgi:hypothetical protein